MTQFSEGPTPCLIRGEGGGGFQLRKCAPLNVAPHAYTMAPLSAIEPHSSPLVKQFYQLGKPIHDLKEICTIHIFV